MNSKKNKQIRNWVFTWNNPGDKGLKKALDADCDERVTYLVFGVEIGKSGTQHLQGYIEMERTGKLQNLLRDHL